MSSRTAEPANWKREISARVQAHRVRRQAHPSLREEMRVSRNMPPRLAGVAATVAERYADAPSYSQYLDKLEGPVAEPAQAQDLFATQGSSALDVAPIEVAGPLPELVTARAVFPPELEAELNAPVAIRANRRENAPALLHPERFLEQATVEPDVPIAPKLIEFPRQLVASRRARPRIAEGPLREESLPEPGEQLRIFEVEPEQISRVPLAAQATASSVAAAPTAEWHYIQLDKPLLTSPAFAPEPEADYFAPTLQIAPLPRRALAAALDVGLVALAFLFFAVSFTAVASGPPSDLASLFASAAIFAALLVGYQWLFFTLSDATPGMRYARISLCTFEDENPTRRQRRMRIVASLFGAASAGLGYAWIWFDQERLGWHDRISRTYQRCY